MAEITTVTFFNFKKNRFWAFQQMGRAPSQMKNLEGLSFFKFLGTGGGNGFSLWPDFSTYAFLGVWDSAAVFEQTFQQHPLFQSYFSKASHTRTLVLSPIASHGKWSGQNPFQPISTAEDISPVVIITRASLRWRKLLSFWKHVPQASQAIAHAKGVHYFKGIGEWPLVQQATLSIWENTEAVHTFAYKSQDHAQIVKKTKQQKWYKEDLFARFQLLSDTQNSISA